jgi:hypothetical protein
MIFLFQQGDRGWCWEKKLKKPFESTRDSKKRIYLVEMGVGCCPIAKFRTWNFPMMIKMRKYSDAISGSITDCTFIWWPHFLSGVRAKTLNRNHQLRITRFQSRHCPYEIDIPSGGLTLILGTQKWGFLAKYRGDPLRTSS